MFELKEAAVQLQVIAETDDQLENAQTESLALMPNSVNMTSFREAQ
jgi:hypothetical protein